MLCMIKFMGQNGICNSMTRKLRLGLKRFLREYGAEVWKRLGMRDKASADLAASSPERAL